MRTFALPGGAGVEMAWCPPGAFAMGSPADEDGRWLDEARHRVTLTEGFWLGRFPVTQAQWRCVMGTSPSRFAGEDRPVERVSWDDCQAFCRRAGAGFRLPTEAEWECACRAGAAGPYGGTGELDGMGWFEDNCDGTRPVGRKRPNDWGLYDMHGNVWEWCADWCADYAGDAVDPVGLEPDTDRIARGGAWCNPAAFCRSAYRSWYAPGSRVDSLGFRLAYR